MIAEGTLCKVKMALGVDDMEMALLVSLYVVLMQAIGESQLYFLTDDHTFLESTLDLGSSLDSHYVQVAISTAALYDYRLSCGLLCFDDELRYWVKPRSTTWFSGFLISLYDDSRWIEYFQIDKEGVPELCSRLCLHIQKEDTKY